MFISESLTVDVPLAAAENRLLKFLHVGDLDSVASTAYGKGATILARAGIGGMGKTVRVQSMPATASGAGAVIAIRWLATGALGGAFPVLDANLELNADGSQTILTILGSYRPPLGKLGEAIDRLMLNTIAKATLRNFLGQLAEVASEVVTSHSVDLPKQGWLDPEQS